MNPSLNFNENSHSFLSLSQLEHPVAQEFEKNRNVTASYISQMNSEFTLKDKMLMEQKIEFLSDELAQFRAKESQNKKLNESILQSYSNNDRSPGKTYKESAEIALKHKEQIRKLKAQFSKQKAGLEKELREVKEQNESLELKIQQMSVENEKRLFDLKLSLEGKHSNKIKELEIEFEAQRQEFLEKLEHAEESLEIYKEYINRKEKNETEMQEMTHLRETTQTRPLEITKCKKQNILQVEQQRSNTFKICYEAYSKRRHQPAESSNKFDRFGQRKILKAAKHDISELNERLNRAMNEIKKSKRPSLRF